MMKTLSRKISEKNLISIFEKKTYYAFILSQYV